MCARACPGARSRALAEAVPQGVCLESLSLAGNPEIADADAAAVGGALQLAATPTLTSLDLSSSKVGGRAGQARARMHPPTNALPRTVVPCTHVPWVVLSNPVAAHES